MLQVLLMLFFFAATAFVPANAWSQKALVVQLHISHATRLMVFSPHPDDETLGAGGLIQRVLQSGGKVKLVYMTSGDGFPQGVEMEDHVSIPTAMDYREYGILRRSEALRATATLGLKKRNVIFLGFPDGGLSYLRSKFLTTKSPYTSPFTRQDSPPEFEKIIPGAYYTGDDVIGEAERLIAKFRPTLVATTPAQDWHPDHSATYFFVQHALTHWDKNHPNLKPMLITFLIHYGHWPVGPGSEVGSRLNPPKGFPDKGIQWVSLPLTPEEVKIKGEAIQQFHSQMLIMGRFLMSFDRSNELYILYKHSQKKAKGINPERRIPRPPALPASRA
jgi:LmbE family N-acetylglucosaminyl deacetylase